MDKLSAAQIAQFNSLKAKLTGLGPRIKCIVEQGRLVSADASEFFLFKGMYKELKPYFDTFNDTWDKLVELAAIAESTSLFPTDHEKMLRQAVERYYYESCAIYEDVMNPTPRPPTATNPATTSNVSLNESRTRARLPPIELMSFNGVQTEWPLFRDTFRALIHEDASLSDIERFLFLLSCLKGTALSLVKGIELQEQNYVQAWKLLNDTYNDRRRLASGYLKTMLEFTPFKSRPTSNALKTLISTVGESVDSFRQLKVPNSEDFILFCLLLRCLDPDTRRAFEKKYAEVEFPTYKNLLDFIKVEWRSLDLTADECPRSSHPKPSVTISGKHVTINRNKPHTSLLVDNKPQNTGSQGKTPASSSCGGCPVCNRGHAIYQCMKFRRSKPDQRVKLLKDWSGCINCLSSRHQVNNCTSQRRCYACAQRHHSWLHINQPSENVNSPAAVVTPSTSGVVLGTQCHTGEILLGTAVIEIKDANDMFQTIRAVIDSGSQHSFIVEKCARRLGLSVFPCTQKVSGIGQSLLDCIKGKVTTAIRSAITPGASSERQLTPIVVSRITSDLPHAEISESIRTRYRSYVLADEEFWRPRPIECLIGADHFYDIITGKPVTVDPNIPRLLPTVFGFVVGGPSATGPVSEAISSLMAPSVEDLTNVMTKFWAVEEVPKRPIVSEEDKLCEKHFASTHYRLSSGRYVVSLPLKDTINSLSNPKQQSLSRLLNLEAKLARDVSLKEDYHKFMSEYCDLGHMKVAPAGTCRYTIPHHAVVKSQNNVQKLRVVFDASCRSASGSLNDHMHAGPKLQLDIGEVITNFRLHTFVFTADIVKMYRQILINPSDRQYQHILWRFSPNEAVQEFELCTVTYGEKASPFLALRTIKQLVQDEGAAHPSASKALSEDIYVDDIATGASTEAGLIQLKEEIITLLAKGQFQLSKWASNCPALLRSLQVEELGDSTISLSDEEDSRIKVLGIQWNPKEDHFSYAICVPPWKPTKRAILSAIARVYDPLGYLSPVIFYAKCLLQEMWLAKVGWDDVGPAEVCNKWRVFLDQLDHLGEIKLYRCITASDAAEHRFVGFSDASQRGYSAVLYLHAITKQGCKVSLLKAKTKLAPIKPMTVPRLELSGALLLARLFQSCKSLDNKLTIVGAHFYTDSQVVLGWLSTPPDALNTFVAHRVVEILDCTERKQWSFVKSEENPADCSSRGIPPAELQHHPLWWAGPLWLSTPVNTWQNISPAIAQELPELKRKPITALPATNSDSPIDEWMEHFSSFSKLVRSAAYVLRLVDILQHKDIACGPILVSEYRRAEKALVKMVQLRVYKTRSLNRDTSLRSLRPFTDAEGYVRVGGRLQNAKLPYDAKHPYLIPADCHFTELLVDHYHRSYLHLGPTALQTMLQTRYWIIGARKIIRKCVFLCKTCYKASRSPQPPIMGNLPSHRLEEGQVFAHVGVDFAGPFKIRESTRRKAAIGKAYLSLFVCMSTKAVHLEVVSSCSTDAFLAALQRFINRRGKPTHMYSDCGTNFVGAANRLRELLILMRSKEAQTAIIQHAVPMEIHWSFNPPSSPHFGGIWEAAIKSTKTILYKVIGENALTFEELATLFCRIEGILNSRPLAPLASDPDSPECLTPGHFLIQRPLTALPEPRIPDKISSLQRWTLIQQKAQNFWARWRLEYLNQLQTRKKWTKEQQNFKPGDVVIIKEPNTTVKSWPLARIVHTHPGQDGVVRVVTIKTSTGIYKRPVAKLIPLVYADDILLTS